MSQFEFSKFFKQGQYFLFDILNVTFSGYLCLFQHNVFFLNFPSTQVNEITSIVEEMQVFRIWSLFNYRCNLDFKSNIR